MAAGITPNAARKPARDRATRLLDAEDAERRRRETERRKRITENVAEIAANDAEIAQLKVKIDERRADSGRRLAAIIGDGVSEPQAAEMTERDVRDVKVAVKSATAARATPSPPKAAKKIAAKTTVAEPGTV